MGSKNAGLYALLAVAAYVAYAYFSGKDEQKKEGGITLLPSEVPPDQGAHPMNSDIEKAAICRGIYPNTMSPEYLKCVEVL